MTLDEAIKELLGEPISNTSQHMYDDFVEANAKFRSDSGLQETIERVEMSKCCDWCHALAGTYSYPEGAPEDIFRRHNRCKCIVTHHSAKGVQDVHTKGFLSQKSIDELERMKKVGLEDKIINNIPQNIENKNNNGIIDTDSRTLLIKQSQKDIIEPDIQKQKTSSIKKSIINYKKRIKEHEVYIKNPYSKNQDWDTLNEEYKTGLLKHWKHEISTFEDNIKRREKELRKRGDL
ncbi:hypothetical protein [Aminicella lysinilytica]|uniref:Uncharacterized protein n=1 Tax=Aminicella lysinilytica TaxID=433323 RepID=A0A4R6QB20_9FIRM|nr:hypothetical protein [Aminicella lysinilytica]TDP59838.1 hypothetical protein EV211_10280 [Aminicella lysinilytica]